MWFIYALYKCRLESRGWTGGAYRCPPVWRRAGSRLMRNLWPETFCPTRASRISELILADVNAPWPVREAPAAPLSDRPPPLSLSPLSQALLYVCFYFFVFVVLSVLSPLLYSRCEVEVCLKTLSRAARLDLALILYFCFINIKTTKGMCMFKRRRTIKKYNIFNSTVSAKRSTLVIKSQQWNTNYVTSEGTPDFKGQAEVSKHSLQHALLAPLYHLYWLESNFWPEQLKNRYFYKKRTTKLDRIFDSK